MQTVEVDGGHLACWDSGSGQALVVIHGAGTPGELLRMDLAALDRRWRLITYDRRGYGASSESPRDWQAHRADAEQLIAQRGAAPAVILGYSSGAIVALDLALRRPDLVASLVLLDPAVFVRRAVTPRLAYTYLKTRLLRRLRDDRQAAEAWIRHVSSYSTGGTAWDRAVPERRKKILANAGGILADLDSVGEDIPEERLAEVQLPVTIVEASLSPAFLRKSVRRLRRLMPQARTVTLESSGHIVMLDARDEMLDVLRRVMTEASGPSRRTG